MILAYCLGERGLRLTAAWATSVGLADISNVALLLRLRQCGDWLALLVGQVLAAATPVAGKGRLIRLVDATMVPKAGKQAKTKNSPWRIHSAFDLPSERFGFFELTDEEGGERLDSDTGGAGRDPDCRPGLSATRSHGRYSRGRRRSRNPERLEERPLAGC